MTAPQPTDPGPRRPSLRELAIRKGTDKEGAHSYTQAYERHLERFRDLPITLLEIGVGGYADARYGGASLRMWKDYFPAGRVIGLDIEDKRHFAQDRITILQGDQGDAAFLDDVAREHGPFDIVIDDGSHQCRHVLASFAALFRHVREGGVYVIEDLQTSYWTDTGGSSVPNVPATSMTMLQRLTDGLNYAEFEVRDYVPSYTDLWVSSVTFYHNIAFVEKGRNVEPSNIRPPHPGSERWLEEAPSPPPLAVPVDTSATDAAGDGVRPRVEAVSALPPVGVAVTPRAGALRRRARRVIPKPIRRALAPLVHGLTALARRRTRGGEYPQGDSNP